MSQIDRSLIVDMSEEVLDEFMCGICHEIFVDPMVTQCCRQTYCNQCIGRWLDSHRTCPNDRRILSRNQLSPPARAMINVFNSMKIKCKYHTNGCQTVLKISEMGSHLKDCSHNICSDCGLGRSSDESHSCVSNLKIKIESISDENKRLKIENKELIEEIKRISQQNRDLKLKKSDDNPFLSNLSPFSPTFECEGITKIPKHFIDGKYVLESKYKTITGGQRIYSRIVDTTLDIISNGINFVFIRSSSDGTETVKRFYLDNSFQWIRFDGKCLSSVFRQITGRNSSRFIERVEDGHKQTVYTYDFDLVTNHLRIEWTVASITKVEVFSRRG